MYDGLKLRLLSSRGNRIPSIRLCEVGHIGVVLNKKRISEHVNPPSLRVLSKSQFNPHFLIPLNIYGIIQFGPKTGLVPVDKT